MPRESDKHGRLLDEELEQEAEPITRGAPPEPRAKETREKEPPGEDQPPPTEEVRDPRGVGDLTRDEIKDRHDVARYIEGDVFPARPDELVASAERLGAPRELVQRLGALPDGHYDRVENVWETLRARVDG